MGTDSRIFGLLVLMGVVFLLSSLSAFVYADAIYICHKDGRQIMMDRPCETIGAATKRIRGPESFQPLSVIGNGLTPGERRMLSGFKARDEADQSKWEADRLRDREAARQAESTNQAHCDQLNAEKQNIVSRLRQNSTQWLNDRHREINDEMYRRRCKTL